MSYPVKYMTSGFAGAPRCSGTAGDMIALLDACLINGFNLLSVVSITVSGEVATVDYGTAHGYVEGQIVLFAGATPTELNGEKYVLSATTTEITFDATGVADGAATGTITSKTAPVGNWEKSFSGTNKGVYRSTDPAGSQLYLRVDDTNDRYALVRGYESMTDVDTGTGEFPTVAQLANGYSWTRSQLADTGDRPWVLVGDSQMFYLFVKYNSYYTPYTTYRFGDFISYKGADGYNCQVGGQLAFATGAPRSNDVWQYLIGYQDSHVARSYTQVGGAVLTGKVGSGLAESFGTISDYPYPSAVDNSLIMHSPVVVVEPDGHHVRGKMPGILQPVQHEPLEHLDIITDVDALPDRRVLIVATAIYTDNNATSRTALDITGPWR